MRTIPFFHIFARHSARLSSGRLLLMIAASGLGTLGLVVVAGLWAGAESDAAALERQRQLMTVRLREQVQQAAQVVDQIGTGYMTLLQTDLHSHTHVARPNSESIDPDPLGAVAAAAMTRIATSVFGFDQAFIVDGSGQLAMQANSEMERRYRWLRPLLQPLLRNPRLQVSDRPSGSNDDGSGNATWAGADGSSMSAVAELMRLEGRPTIVGIVSLGGAEGDERGSGGGEVSAMRYLITVRFLDGEALDDLSREQGLNGARYARSSDPEENEVAFQIDATATGEPIGFIVWSPDLPGSRVIARLVPALSFAALVIAILFSALLIRLRRSLVELRTSELQARHLAVHDVLTKLPNRALFAERLEACLAETSAVTRRSAVVLIDLDRFKAVNDTFGHAAGDELIRLAASRMLALLRPQDTLARLGGDEFAVLLLDVGGGDAVVAAVCDKLVDVLAQPYLLTESGALAHVGSSLGVAFVPDVGRNASDVMRYADLALYEAKACGRGRWMVFEPSMDNGRSAREVLKNELRAVLAGAAAGDPWRETTTDFGSLEVHFQSVHRPADGYAVSGAEALIRWRHPEHGLLPPSAFVPIAEEGGLINELGSWVLREACRAACSWDPSTFVAVNVSAHQLREPSFADNVLASLGETGLAPSRLELELTESALLDDNQEASDTLARLRLQGVQISLDDFGTGFSSLSHLIRLGVDRIKIDRSFVELLGTKANGVAIIAALVALGRNLGIATTAEGVETEAQRDFLVALGCTDLQGYLFSKPAPIESLSRFPALQGRDAAASAPRRGRVI